MHETPRDRGFLMVKMNERLAVLRALMRDMVANGKFACEGCGNSEYHRIIVFDRTDDGVGTAANMVLKCAECIENDGGIAVDGRSE